MTPVHSSLCLLRCALVAGLWVGLVSAGLAADERTEIEETRRLQTERFDAQARDCATQFATTRCQDKVRAERLRLEAQIRQRETVLNDAERQLRGQEQMERNRVRAEAHALKLSSPELVGEQRTLPPKAAPQPGGTAQTPRVSESKTLLTEAQRSLNARSYERKQAQALTKRAEIAKKTQEKGASKAPLPTPP